ncbi:MAG: hypothetical protein RIR73_94 [Chloroflexota bacterium]
MNKKSILILGDIITLALLTIIGFATHGEAGASFLPRMAASFVPMAFGWFVLAPWLGLFDETTITSPKNIIRIPLAMLFVTPLAVILRAAWLNSAGLPIFALALGGTNMIGMLVWRGLYIFIAQRMK